MLEVTTLAAMQVLGEVYQHLVDMFLWQLFSGGLQLSTHWSSRAWLHRRSQDFVWGALFAKKVDDLF